MISRKIMFYSCMITSALCLSMGYGFSKQWIGFLAAILMIPAWLLAHKHGTGGFPLICLLVSLSLAVIGQLTGCPPLWMICGAALALAAWDLLLLDVALGSNRVEEQTIQFEKEHLRSLTFVLGTGLFVVFIGRLFTLKIPFAVLVLFVILIPFAIDRTFQQIKRTR